MNRLTITAFVLVSFILLLLVTCSTIAGTTSLVLEMSPMSQPARNIVNGNPERGKAIFNIKKGVWRIFRHTPNF